MLKQYKSKIGLLDSLKKIKDDPNSPNFLHHESDKAFEWLANSLQISLFNTTLKGKILYVNDNTRRLFDYDTVEEIYAINILTRYKDKNDRKLFLQKLKEFSKVEHFETEFLTKTGKTKNVVLSAIVNGDLLRVWLSILLIIKKPLWNSKILSQFYALY